MKQLTIFLMIIVGIIIAAGTSNKEKKYPANYNYILVGAGDSTFRCSPDSAVELTVKHQRFLDSIAASEARDRAWAGSEDNSTLATAFDSTKTALDSALNYTSSIANIPQDTTYTVVSTHASTGASSFSTIVGFGDKFNKAGLTFNAVAVDTLILANTDTTGIYYIQFEVRDVDRAGTVLAKSQVLKLGARTVIGTNTTWSEQRGLLYEPTLTNRTTLTDASFSGSTYMIGYRIYDNLMADHKGSHPTGTQTNYEGNSYYYTFPTGWKDFYGDTCFPISHIYEVITNLNVTSLNSNLGITNTRVEGVNDRVEVVNDRVDSVGLALQSAITNILSDSTRTIKSTQTITGASRLSGSFYGNGIKLNEFTAKFNVLRVDSLYITYADSGAQYIQIEVRDISQTGTILAYSRKERLINRRYDSGESRIYFGKQELELYNPALTDTITLDQDDFTSTYMIGFKFYAADGVTLQQGGYPTGTQTNYEGNSFYYSTGWKDFYGDPCFPISHIFKEYVLSSLTEMAQDSKIILDSLGVRLDAINPNEIATFLPDTMYAVTGDTLQVFFRGIIESKDPYKYHIELNCAKGRTYNRFWEYAAVNADTTAVYPLTIKIYEENMKLLGADTTIVKAKKAWAPAAVNIMPLGDSFTDASTWVDELYRRISGTGGTPPGLGFTDIDFVGNKGTGDARRIGYSGKSWSFYAGMTVATTSLKFQFYGTHDKDASDIGSIWSDGTNNWALDSSSTGHIAFTKSGHTVNPPASGTLTHVSGASHTSSITYTTLEAIDGNPLWDYNTSALSFIAYCTRHGLSGLDALMPLMTWNGQTPYFDDPTEHTTLETNMKIVIDAYHSQYPSGIVLLAPPTMPSIRSGLGVAYGSTGVGYGAYSNYYGMVQTVLGVNRLYRNYSVKTGYTGWVIYVPTTSQFDNENNFGTVTKKANIRNTAASRELYDTNGIHPSTYGYYQIADSFFRTIIHKFCR